MQFSVETIKNAFERFSSFSLENLDGFPYIEWTQLQGRYTHYEKWFDGSALYDEEIAPDGSRTNLYPLKMNPLPATAQKHASVLLGQYAEVISGNGLPVDLRIAQQKPEKKRKIDVKKQPEKPLLLQEVEKVFQRSSFPSLMYSAAITSQYLGGAVLGVVWDLRDGFRIRSIYPKEFVGIPYRDNYWRLREAWVVRTISAEEAKEMGYVPSYLEGGESGFTYVEHWTESRYRVLVNGKPLLVDGFLTDAENPFGVVPFVYIPHIRVGNFFYGIGHIDDATIGFVREMNLRNADIGDSVNEDAHNPIAIRNTRALPQLKKIGGVLTVVDLGNNNGLSANEKQPDMFSTQRASTSEPMLKFASEVYRYYRRHVFHPSIADGEDEGSQRSALNLVTRLFPLTEHIKAERLNWTDGLTTLTRILLKMMAVKMPELVSEEDAEAASIYIGWPPMIARDREAAVNEIATRIATGTISRRHALEIFADSQDIERELAEIEAEKKREEVVAGRIPPQKEQPFGEYSMSEVKSEKGE